ncbi:MAG: LPS export ABC transporter permease LptG [Gammaproteobacteria bacterium]|nr:LPS export ABC transporter permease LptG [Gammaproteobacteria bacterium]
MILERYIAANLVKGWLLVLLVLGAVFGLIGFIQELDHTRFDYNALAVGRYTLFVLPQQLVSLAPVIALLGSIVALAGLDRFNELTIISCTGFSRTRLLGAIGLPTAVLMAVLWLCMEYVTPPMLQSAEAQRQALRYHNQVRIPDGGVWSKNGNRYIHLDKMHKDGVPGDIDLFEFDESGQLTRALRAETAVVSRNRTWLFQNVWEKLLVNRRLVTRHHDTLEIGNLWSPDELPTLALESDIDSMRLSVLRNYSQYRADNGQPFEKYLSAFWQKLLMPLTVAAMVLLATPISANLGARRDRSFGVDIALGALVGILFYLGTQIVFALGQLLGLNIPLVALAPTLVILLCAAILLRRMHW